ncbi:MAG: hypothetical protein ACI38Q_02655 [Candidatus Bruticola sp.]
MTSSNQAALSDNEPLHIQELVPGSICKLIIAAYDHHASADSTKEQIAPQAHEELINKITKMLEENAIEVSGIERSLHTGEGFEALIYGNYLITDNPDLALLRSKIKEEGHKLGLSIRMQRSELFSYMHRI